ncbi:unnamed protein product [Fusarium graminearum]|nr:unnamed protein product [Fusarium graminearum]
MAHQILITSTISEATGQCANAFSDILLRAVYGYEVPDLAMLKEHHARFYIWAEKQGVSLESNSSPKDHLYHAPDAKNVILKLLQRLKATLEAVLSHNLDSQNPDTPEETNDEDIYSSDSSLGISEDDDIGGELELATESHFVTSKHTQVIGEIISHLYRFTSIVEQQDVYAEDERINQWVLGEGRKLDHQLEGLRLYMSYLLDSDIPTLQPYLRDRLIHTVVHRRKRLLYQQDCSVKLYSSVRVSSNSKERELASRHQDVPDIRPYICLFQNCNTPLRQFTTKNDWISHMSSQHTRVWVCQVKGHETYLFRNPADLETHLQDQHSDIVGTDQVSFLAAKSARANSDILGALAIANIREKVNGLPVCPFCNLNASVFEPKHQLAAPSHCPTAETSKETYQKACDHMAGHLKVIAHESLPPALQTPRPSSLRSFKIAIICDSPLTVRAMYGIFNEGSNMDHMFVTPIHDANLYSLAAIGRHNVVLVRMSKMYKNDLETLFSDVRGSLPCVELFVLVDVYSITPPRSNVDITFGDVIVGDRVEEGGLMGLQYPYLSNFCHKPGARLRSLLGKMRTPRVRKMVQQRISTNPEVLSKYESLAATYRKTEHSKDAIQTSHSREDRKKFAHDYEPQRLPNGAPEPHFHFGEVGSRLSSFKITGSDDLDFDKEQSGKVLKSFPCLIVQSTCDSIPYRQNKDERESYAATTAAAFTSAILDLWPSMSLTEISAIHDPVYHIPIPKNEGFVERKTSMKNLQDKLFRGGTEQVTIYGSDGSGKTQLALWLAYWAKEHMHNYSIFWASAMSKEAFDEDCHRIVENLDCQCTGENDPKVVLQRYLSSESSGRWILILDDASDEDLTYGKYDHPFEISKFLPNNRKGLILVTTTSAKVALTGDAVVTLSNMTLDESLSLLTRSLVGKSHDQTLMRELLQIISHYPLPVLMTAAYININEVPVSSYLGLLMDEKRSANIPFDISHTPLSLCKPFDVSFEHIEKHHNLAAKMLVFVSFFKPNTIRSPILPDTENVQQFNEAMKTLYEYGFLVTKYDGDLLHTRSHIHRATQVWMQKRNVADCHRGAVAAHLVRILTPKNLETRQLWNRYLLQIMNFLAEATQFHRDICNLGCLVGRHLHQIGCVEEAIEVFEGLIDSQSDALLEDEASYLNLQFELGRSYLLNSQSLVAIDLLEHVVATRDRTLTESHPDRLASQHELARAYLEIGLHEEAIRKILEHQAAVGEMIEGVDKPKLLEL